MSLFYRYIRHGFSHFPALPEKKLHFLACFDQNQDGHTTHQSTGFCPIFLLECGAALICQDNILIHLDNNQDFYD